MKTFTVFVSGLLNVPGGPQPPQANNPQQPVSQAGGPIGQGNAIGVPPGANPNVNQPSPGQASNETEHMKRARAILDIPTNGQTNQQQVWTLTHFFLFVFAGQKHMQ